MRRSDLRLRLLAAALTTLGCSTVVSPRQAPRTSDAAAGERATIHALLVEAREAARRAPDVQRLSLLERVGHQQTRTGDFAGAEATIGLVTLSARSDTITAAQRIETNVLCTLLERHRSSDAMRFVARVRSIDDRSWLQARLASQMAAGHEARLFVSTAGDDTTGQLSRALDVARGISTPEARVDALIAIAAASEKHPSFQGRAAREAIGALNAIGDPDRRQSRTAMLISPLFRAGELQLVLRLFGQLTDPSDRTYAARALWYEPAGQAAPPRAPDRDSLRDAIVRRAVAEAARETDAEVSRAYLAELRETLLQAGRRALADSLVPERRVAADSPSVVVPSALDRAREALRRQDFTGVRSAMSQSVSAAREASGWAQLAWETYSWNRDSAATFLVRARDALLRGPVDSAAFDDIALTIARHQSWIGEQEAGIATLDLVRGPSGAQHAAFDWGSSTFSNLNAVRLRALVERLRLPGARDHFFLRIISGYLLTSHATAADVAWATALADSIGTPAVRDDAQSRLANYALARGDSAMARRIFETLLPSGGPTTAYALHSPEQGLEDAGGRQALLAWARGGAHPVVRASRLLRVAEVIERRLDAREHKPRFISNGPDRCRDEF